MFDDESNPISLKNQVWRLCLRNPGITIESIQRRILHNTDVEPSKITVAAILAAYRDVAKFLVAQNVVSASLLEDGVLNRADVTLSRQPKRYNRKCVSCGRDFITSRKHTETCSSRCRVKYHRDKMKMK
jgi:hypothetical protein